MARGGAAKMLAERNGQLSCGPVVEEKDQWVQRLRIAVAKQAADDLRAALRTHDDGAVTALCNWFGSEWGQLLCFGYGRAIVSRIKKEEREREQTDT